MADLHVRHGARGPRSRATRISEVLRHRAVDPRSGGSGQPAARTGAGRVPRRRVPLPGRRGARAARHLVHGRTRRDDRDRRQHRQRQVDARSTSSRASTTSRAARSSSTASTCATMDRADLWSRIGLVPQRAFLFGGTVASNLRFGDETASDEDLWRALEIAQGREFVEEMPEGLEAPIAQGGTNVSGGQRQRLAIARALVKRPRRSTSSTTASRPSTSAPTPGCARPSRRDLAERHRHHRGPARGHDPARRPDRRARRRRRSSAIGTHDELHARPARPTARSSTRSSPRRRSRERAGHGPRAGRAARRRAAAARAGPAADGPMGFGHAMPAGEVARTSGAPSGACSASSGRSACSSVVVMGSRSSASCSPSSARSSWASATDLIFEGVVGTQLACRGHDPGPGRSRPCGPAARTTWRTCWRAWTSCRARASTSARSARSSSS